MDIHSLISTWRTHYQQLAYYQRKKLKIIAFFLAISLLALLIYWINVTEHPKTKINTPLLIREGKTIKIPDHSPLRQRLAIRAVQTANTPHVIALPAIIEADQTRSIPILPPVAGRLLTVNTQLGNDVKEGQILATIQSAGMAQAYADKIKAQSALRQATEAWNRVQKVNRAGANSVKDVELVKNDYLQAQAEMQRAQITLATLGQNKESLLEIQAPMDGKITAVNYGPGAYLIDQTTPIFNLTNINTVWVTLCVPEQISSSIQKGQKAQIQVPAYPQKTWEGSITFTNSLIDAESRCNKSRISLLNADKRLQPNMFATVHTEIPQKPQVLVPLSALIMNNDAISVFVETAPWTFTQRPVTLGPEDKGQVRITSGLKSGARIVVAGGILIND